MTNRHFNPKLFSFLRDLADNNDRDWFKAHQDEYEKYVREPALEFITTFSQPLDGISPHFRADSRKSGGSLFRIQRDIRFSTDRSPYKTNTGMHFRHEMARDVHAPGFYLHLEPGACFMGAGIWRPDTRTQYRIREAIDARPDVWRKVTGGKAFRQMFDLMGDSLVRPPKGYDPGHPLLEDLKRKDFVAGRTLTHKEVTAPDFLDRFTADCRRTAPFVEFLCQAVEVPF